MAIDPWLPSGFALAGADVCRRVLHDGAGWQIYETMTGGRALVVQQPLLAKWTDARLLEHVEPISVSFGGETLAVLVSGEDQSLSPVTASRGPTTAAEAVGFAIALKETRRVAPDPPLYDAIYVERISRLLPTWSLAAPLSDDIVLGTWLSGGVRVSTNSFRRLSSLVGRLDSNELKAVIEAAGLSSPSSAQVRADALASDAKLTTAGSPIAKGPAAQVQRHFELPGRVVLEAFFREHVIDVVENEARYAALGIGFPAPIALYGPPGSGKTFAVERLVEYLGWPSFAVDSSTIASPYIHETGKKIAKVFEEAIAASPSVVVIDEMESFLSDRQAGGGQALHHVEEVAEFLRRIPEAIENRVLVIGMTNRIEMIDAAILRRGRFDHVIEVGMPTEVEVRSLLTSMLSAIPGGGAIHVGRIATRLAARPLSDAAFVVREAARLAARAGREAIDDASIEAAISAAPARSAEAKKPAMIGFRTT